MSAEDTPQTTEATEQKTSTAPAAAEENSSEKAAPKDNAPTTSNEEKSNTAADGSGTVRILVTEDSTPLRRMLEKILKSDGFEVDTAENGEIALKLLREANENPYTLMVLDIMMPVLDGIKTIATIKKENIENVPPVIICSARSDRETIQLVNKLGVEGYILKPFKTEVVLQKVRQMIYK